MSSEDYVAALKAGYDFPEGALDYSGPGLTSPGETVDLWLTLDPGRYILICWNAGHATSTPVREITVEGTPADDEPPQANVVLRLVDYRFEMEGTLESGNQIIRVETPGPSMHEVDIFRLDENTSVADLLQWRSETGGRSDFPVHAVGGVLDSHDVTRVAWLRRVFTPGRYLLHCEMPMSGPTSDPNADTTSSHADVGMFREIEIAK